MARTVPNTFVALTKAKAAEVNANFSAILGFFTEGSGGIADADCSTSMDLNSALKLSQTVGKQIPTDAIADDAVTFAKLKDDTAAGSALAAVNTKYHVRSNVLPADRLFISFFSQAVGAGSIASMTARNFNLGQTLTNYFPVAAWISRNAIPQLTLTAGANIEEALAVTLHHSQTNDTYFAQVKNTGGTSVDVSGMTLYYLLIKRA